MNRFFVEGAGGGSDRITLTGADANHICSVLRLRTGEELQVVDPLSGATYTCSIESADKSGVVCVIEDMQTESRELPVEITLYQGLPKSDKLEYVIQKAVELGAARIVPVAMKRSVVKLTADKADKKLSRWNAIAESAAAQSKRTRIPEVGGVMTYDEALADASKCDAMLLPYELAAGPEGDGDDASGRFRSDMDRTRQLLSGLREAGTRSIAVFIGPEGGFDPVEVERATDAGAHIITLGNRILRTETAPLTILSWLIYIFEE